MSPDGSIPRCLSGIRRNESEAIEIVWNRYRQALVRVADRTLNSSPRKGADEEDAAVTAFNTFVRRAADGQFYRLNNRHDLWSLLTAITVRKALKLRRKEERAPLEIDPGELACALDTLPQQEMVTMFEDQLSFLFEQLGDPQLREIVLLKLEGYTNQEIAERFGRHVSFTERKLRLIRKVWSTVWEAPTEC